MSERWAIYFGQVENRHALILLNLALWDYSEQASEKSLYLINIAMNEPGEYGIGTTEEGDAIAPLEDAIIERVENGPIRYVAHVRSNGLWQLVFMGPDDCAQDLQQQASAVLAPSARAVEYISRPDPEWSYYRGVLFPNRERQQWINDMRVVTGLMEDGDPLTSPRRVDHWLYFPSKQLRSECAQAVRDLGFETIEQEPQKDNSIFGLQIHRVDSVELNSIHEVTWTLTKLAEHFQGQYDGWETSVEKPR